MAKATPTPTRNRAPDRQGKRPTSNVQRPTSKSEENAGWAIERGTGHIGDFTLGGVVSPIWRTAPKQTRVSISYCGDPSPRQKREIEKLFAALVRKLMESNAARVQAEISL